MAGIHAEISKERCDYWSAFAPLPVEVVISAGQKAKEANGKSTFLHILHSFYFWH